MDLQSFWSLAFLLILNTIFSRRADFAHICHILFLFIVGFLSINDSWHLTCLRDADALLVFSLLTFFL